MRCGAVERAGVANFVGTGALVTTIRESSVKNEKEAGLLARLRADILPHASW